MNFTQINGVWTKKLLFCTVLKLPEAAAEILCYSTLISELQCNKEFQNIASTIEKRESKNLNMPIFLQNAEFTFFENGKFANVAPRWNSCYLRWCWYWSARNCYWTESDRSGSAVLWFDKMPTISIVSSLLGWLLINYWDYNYMPNSWNHRNQLVNICRNESVIIGIYLFVNICRNHWWIFAEKSIREYL